MSEAMKEKADGKGQGAVQVKGFARIIVFAIAWCLVCVVAFMGSHLYDQVSIRKQFIAPGLQVSESLMLQRNTASDESLSLE